MEVDVDPFQTKEAHYVEPVEILMVEATRGFDMDIKKDEQTYAVADEEM